MAPAETAAVHRQGILMGNNSDLYPRWLGARELLLHGRDPYSADVTRDIQSGFYGRPLDPRNPSDPVKQEAFVYPLYVVFLIAPTVTMSFATVAEIFRWFLLFAVAASVPLWMRAISFRAGILLAISGMLLAVSSSPAISEYHQQNLAGLVILFLAAAAAAAARNWLMLSGFLLALATIKPDFSGPLILWFLFWSASSWKVRQRVIWSFAGTLAALLVAAEIVSPHWVPRFVTAVRHYTDYGIDPSVLRLFFPSFVANLAIAALLVSLGLVCWKSRNAPAGTEDFGWALAWVVTVTLAIIPKTAAYNQPLLIPALLILLARYRRISQAGRFPRAMVKAVLLCLLWEWATALILALASLFIPAANLAFLAFVPEYTSLALTPISLLALMAATLAIQRKARTVSPA